MKHRLVFKDKRVQDLQNRVSELEQQLAEAQAAIRRLSVPARKDSQIDPPKYRVEELYAIIQTLHDPVLVYDQNGVITLANTSAIRAHGFDPTGHHRRDTNETLMAHSPDGERVHSDALPSARALQGEIVIDEALTITNSHGQELSILVTSSPLIVNGIQNGVVSVWRDVTEQKKAEKAKEAVLAQVEEDRLLLEKIMLVSTGAARDSHGRPMEITESRGVEEALRRSEERFRSLADSMPQLVWMAQPDGTVDYYNSRYREYQEIRQVAGPVWEWSPVLHPDDLQPTIDAWQHSVKTGEVYQIEHRVRMADGSYRWHLSRGLPVHSEEGKVIRWFGTATDIQDVKLAEEQLKVYAYRLEHSNRELEQFAFIASHDLQEPLRKIEVFGDLLLERSTSMNGRERNYVDRMRDAARRMRNMVEGLLQLSRVTTQGKPFVQVNLQQVAAEVLHDLEDQIRRTGGAVNLETLPAVEGDALQLHHLLQNLIGNALKYHPPEMPPEVKVYAKELSGKVQILVEDKGIGFDQEQAERIFQPFQRLVGRSQYEGSGMGLAICRRIVERHNGEITALSKPGDGARFIVTLPVYQSERTRKDSSNEGSGTIPGR